MVFIILFSLNASGETVDSLLQVLAEQEGSSDLGMLYEVNERLAIQYGHEGTEEYDKSIAHYLICYDLAKELNDPTKITASLFYLGYNNERQNNYQDALAYYNDVIEMDDNLFKNEHKSFAYSQISTIHQSIGDYESAYENQMQALSIYDIENDTLGKVRAHYTLGNIFYYQSQFDQALEHYEKSKSYADILNQERATYSCLAALGSVHEKLENYDTSIEYNKASLELAKKLNYKTGIAYAMGNLATNYKKQGKMDQAEKAMKESLDLKIAVGDRIGAIGSNVDLSNLYLEWNKPKLGLPFLEEALAISLKLDAKGRQPEIYQTLSAIHSKMNDPVKALFYINKYIALKDSLISEKTVEEMGQSKQRYQVREQEYEIAMLKKTNEILGKDGEIRQQQIYIFAIAFVAFLMFLWWYKSKLDYQNKVNRLLGEKNSLLADKNEEIHIKNKQLENSNEDLQQFAYVASHDLKEPLRMINSYTNLLSRRYNELFDESGKEFMFYVVDAVKRMETLLDDLLDFSRAGTQPAPTQFIPLEDVMVIVESNLRHRLQTLNATLVIKTEHLPKVKAHRTMLIQLLQNLVSNGVKFKGERDPQVIVDCKKEENQYVLSVADNGIGISAENLEKVFEMFRRLHTRDEYEGTGIGLATCKRIVTTWGGDIWVESIEGEGSTFFFSFPVSVAEMETVAVG